MNLHGKYSEKLHNMPAPGTGCHHSLLGAANYGIMAEITPEAEALLRSVQGGVDE